MAAEEPSMRGGKEMAAQAAAGMALFEASTVADAETDTAAAEAFKTGQDELFKQLEDEANALTGKDNKKARAEKSKEASNIKKTDQYIDAELVLKGKQPKHGYFIKTPVAKAAPAAAAAAIPAATDEAAQDNKKDEKEGKKDDKKAKKVENAGISKAERDELEKLKNDIIARKSQLKGEGMSGGQINKDEQIAAWVARMNELKEKECPGSTTAGKKDDKKDAAPGKKKLSSEQEKEIGELEREVEAYKDKLRSEFKYSKKEIEADPDYQEMMSKLKKVHGKK